MRGYRYLIEESGGMVVTMDVCLPVPLPANAER